MSLAVTTEDRCQSGQNIYGGSPSGYSRSPGEEREAAVVPGGLCPDVPVAEKVEQLNAADRAFPESSKQLPEEAGDLDPYWELDLPKDTIAQDYRAEFDPEVPGDGFAEEAARIVSEAEKDHLACAAGYRASLAAKDYAAIFVDWHGGQLGPDGDWGHYYNPQAKWDWFVIGGRWQGSLHLLPGRTGETGEQAYDEEQVQPGTADQTRYGDVDWAKTRKPAGKFTPFAVLKHGEWYEIGEMGWWGVASNKKDDAAWEEKVSRLLADVPADELVSVFDCHI